MMSSSHRYRHRRRPLVTRRFSKERISRPHSRNASPLAFRHPRHRHRYRQRRRDPVNMVAAITNLAGAFITETPLAQKAVVEKDMWHAEGDLLASQAPSQVKLPVSSHPIQQNLPCASFVVLLVRRQIDPPSCPRGRHAFLSPIFLVKPRVRPLSLQWQ